MALLLHDIESAIRDYNLSLPDIKHRISNEELRYAVPRSQFPPSSVVVPLYALPDEVIGAIHQLNAPDLLDLFNTKINYSDLPEEVEKPEFLYLNNYWLKRARLQEDEPDQPRIPFVFETFEGTYVTFWSDSEDSAICRLAHVYTSNVEDGLLSSASFTAAELDRVYRPTPDDDQVTVEENSYEVTNPFVEPKPTNDVAIAMCSLGNEFFKEKNKVPSCTELQTYAIKKGESWGITFDKKKDAYDFNGTRVKTRQFKERYNSYCKTKTK